MRSNAARRRRILIRAVASIFATLPAGFACGAPQGAQVVAGSAAVSSVGSTLFVHQSSNRAIINWSDFSINPSETVKFVLPSSSSAVLNRVISLNPSLIYGTLSSNGTVYLINPNGVLIGPSGVIDVHSFVASSLNVDNASFMAGGDLLFSGNSAASVINQGVISTPTGDVVMIAQQVRNDGQIAAIGGSVHLIGGQQVLLQQAATPGMTVRIIGGDGTAGNTGVIQTTLAELAANGGNAMALAINNTGIIRATGVQNSGGHIYLTAGASGEVSNNGTLDVSSSTGAGGQIVVTGQDILIGSQSLLNANGATGGGQILVGGSWQNDDPSIPQAIGDVVLSGAVLEASATQSGDGGMVVVRSDVTNPDSVTRAYGTFLANGAGSSGNGGEIETSGYWLDTAGSTVSAAASGGKAGQWLLDPFDLTITTAVTSNFNIASNPWVPTASGGNVAASDIENALNIGSNVTISTGSSGTDLGNITDDAAIAKTAGGTAVTLTFQANNNITINQPITSNSGALNIVFQAHQGSAGAIILDADLTTNGGSISFGIGQTSGGSLIGGDVYLNGGSAQTLSTAGGSVTVAGQMLIANPSGLTINTAGGPVDFQGTVDSGDSYVLVNTSTTWDNALILAKGATAGGAGIGDTYLATITSSLENTIASEAANYNPAWLGGERVLGIGTNAIWRWVTGPEGLQNSGQGMEFFTSVFSGGGGTPIGTAYTNWNPGEPNNSGGANVNQNGETVLQFVGTSGLWNDLNESSPTNPYLVETNLTPSPLTVNAGSGQVTFSAAVGGNKALGSLTVTGPLAINGGSVITTGAQTYNNATTLGTTATVLSVTNADLNLGQNVTYSGGTAATLTLQASGSVILGSNAAIAAAGAGAMSVTIDSHNSAGTDTGNSGAIVLGSGASISTKGGNITLGGGVTPLTVPAYGTLSNIYGIDLNGATLNSAGGTITMNGTGVSGTSSSAVGVLVDAASSITAAGGAISITGIGGANSVNDNNGVLVQAGSSIATTSGPLSITGTGGGSSGTSANDGVSVENSTITSASGALGITGAGGVGTNSNGSSGISFLSGTSSIQSTGVSPILLTATPGTGSASIGISAVAPGNIGGASDTGNITVNSNSVAFDNSGAAVTFQSSGQLLIQPQALAASIGVGSGATGTLDLGSAAVSNIHSGFSQVIIGNASGTGAVDIGTAAFNDPVTIRSPLATVNDLTVNGALSATTGAITLQAGRSIIENAGASITTNNAAVMLDADANADQNGNIQILGGSITTNGGAMLLGGGGSPSTTPAYGVTAGGSVATSSGIFLDQATLDSAGGNISLRGAGVTSAAPANAVGVMIEDSTSIDSGTGSVFVFGTSATGGTGGNSGVEIGYQNTLGTGTPGVTGSSITSSSTSPNAIIISGTGSTSGASDSAGITLQNGSSVTTTGTGGGVTLNGTGGTFADNSNPGNQGISLDAGTTISSTGGNVTLNASSASGVAGISNFNTGTHTISANPTTGIVTLNPSSGGADLDSTTLTGSQLLLSGSGDFTLTDPSNSISTVAGNVAAGNVQVTNAASLTVGTVSGVNGLTATGGNVTLLAQGATSDLVLNQPIAATGTNTTVTLLAGQNFINNAGPSAIDPGTGRFLVYATDPATSTVGGLTAGHLYNSTYTNYPPASVTQTGNQILYGLNAVLTFTATDQTRVYGQPNPTLTYTFSGLVGGDTISQATTGSPALSTAPDTVGVGNYPIDISLGTLVSPLRYQFNFVVGNMSVTPAPLTITAVDLSKVYGAPLPAFTANYTTLVNGDSASAISGLIFTTNATAASNVGPYTITPSGGTSPNYTIAFAPGTLTVTPAPLTIIADDKSRAAEANNPTLTATFRTLVNGDQPSAITGLTLSTTAEFSSSPGDYPIQVAGGADANYAITLIDGTMHILNVFTESLQAEQGTATGLIPNFATGSVSQTNTNVLPSTGSNSPPADAPAGGHSGTADVFYRDVSPLRNTENGTVSIRLERLLRDAFTHVSSYDVKNENQEADIGN